MTVSAVVRFGERRWSLAGRAQVPEVQVEVPADAAARWATMATAAGLHKAWVAPNLLEAPIDRTLAAQGISRFRGFQDNCLAPLVHGEVVNTRALLVFTKLIV
jgi:hypothetical protein